jgi:virulence factor Mce-like protein
MSPLLRRGKRKAGKRGLPPLAIAAITIFVVVAITYYAFSQSIPFVSNYTLHALVNNSVALRTDAPVRIAGIDVGVVQGVAPAGQNSEITFTMDDNGLPIHKDATIRIKDRLFLEGGYYLELNPGSPSAPLLHEGDTIPASQVQPPVQFYSLLSTFDIDARKSLESTLNTLNDGLSANDHLGNPVAHPGAAGLKQTVPQLTPTLKDLAWITRGLHGTHPGDVQTLLSSAASVTTTLAHNSSQLTDLVTSLNRTSRALAAADGALAQSVTGLDQTLQVAPGALTAIDRSLPPLATLAVALDPSLKVAPKLVDGLTNAVTQLAAVVRPAARARLLTSLKATFQQFPSLLTKLGSLFPITKSVTDCLRTHVTPVFQSTVPDGSHSTGQPVWQEFVHMVTGFSSQAQNFDGNGHWVRFSEGVGTNTFSLGNLPIIGPLLSPGAGAGAVIGASPAWVGDLSPDAYHPEAPCANQVVPSLASPATASDMGRTVAIRKPSKPIDINKLRVALGGSAKGAKK